MKKIIAVCLTLMLLLTGCSSGVPQAEYDKLKTEYDAVVKERDTLKKMNEAVAPISKDPASSSSDSLVPVFDLIVTFDKDNNASVIFYEDEGIQKAAVTCTFDRKNRQLEFARVLAFGMVISDLGLNNYTVITQDKSDSPDFTTMMVTDGEIQDVDGVWPGIYADVWDKSEENEDLAIKEYSVIIKQVSDGLSKKSKDSSVNKESTTVLLYDDKYMSIQFFGCENDEYDKEQVVFQVENKTDTELTFQGRSLSFDGLSLGNPVGANRIAAKSAGKIRFYVDEKLPTFYPKKITGKFAVLDYSEVVFGKTTFDVDFVDVALE